MRSSVPKRAARTQAVTKLAKKASQLVTHILVGPTNHAARV